MPATFGQGAKGLFGALQQMQTFANALQLLNEIRFLLQKMN